MIILIINAGSSSLKYQLFDITEQSNKVIAKGLCERIGIDGRVKHVSDGRDDTVEEIPMASHADAIRILTAKLVDPATGVLKSMDDIDAVGHRVLHAGEKYASSVMVTPEVIEAVEECIPLGPLHNPANLTGIRACEEVMPNVPQVAVFDTAFHQSMPPHAFIYPLPYEYYTKHHIRRYGFHGTSHRYVSRRAAELLGRDPKGLKVITCHLGNGSSIAAVRDGLSIDTSMGLTPLEGLPMGTRSGSIDPAIISFLKEREKISAEQVLEILNKKSGVLGISGISSDFRDLDTAVAEGSERAKLALNIFCYDSRKYIGSYAAAMGGLDCIVMTGGIGENNAKVREQILNNLEFMGVELDKSKNNARPKNSDISRDGSRVRILVIETNEELVIALDTLEIINATK